MTSREVTLNGVPVGEVEPAIAETRISAFGQWARDEIRLKAGVLGLVGGVLLGGGLYVGNSHNGVAHLGREVAGDFVGLGAAAWGGDLRGGCVFTEAVFKGISACVEQPPSTNQASNTTDITPALPKGSKVKACSGGSGEFHCPANASLDKQWGIDTNAGGANWVEAYPPDPSKPGERIPIDKFETVDGQKVAVYLTQGNNPQMSMAFGR